MNKQLRKAGANWVDGDRFFDREAEIEALMERVREGTHTLLTAQRRMGKTSLVRELLRRLNKEGDFATVFVDLEGRMRTTRLMPSPRLQFRLNRSRKPGTALHPASPTAWEISVIISRRWVSPT